MGGRVELMGRLVERRTCARNAARSTTESFRLGMPVLAAGPGLAAGLGFAIALPLERGDTSPPRPTHEERERSRGPRAGGGSDALSLVPRMVGYLYPSGSALDLELVVFDKDGTILDFAATWHPGFRECARSAAAAVGEPDLEPALLKAGGWVEEGGAAPRITQDGLMLHGTLEQLAQAWIDTQPIVAAHFGADGAAKLTALMEEVLAEATVRDATPLGPVEPTLRALRRAGLQLAIVTNDQEALAKAQLAHLGWTDLFCAVIGADSGHGAKPGPGGVRAAIEAAGVEPSQTIMVGDAEGDMTAGRRAGCAFTVAIWGENQPLPAGLASAACRMPHIGELPTALAAAGWRAPPTTTDTSADVDGLAAATADLALSENASEAIDARERWKREADQSQREREATAARAQEAVTAASAAAEAAAAVDPDIISLVDGMLPAPREDAPKTMAF